MPGGSDLVAMLLLELAQARSRGADPEVAAEQALAWLRDRDPLGTHTVRIVRELQRITGPDRLNDGTDYAIEARLLSTLTRR